jgi:drug/metabolite transporter (DMT)-like permease
VTIRSLAIGLTIWFAAVAVFGAVAMETRLSLPSALEVLLIYSFYLLPVRWMLVLTLLIRRARAKPRRRLPTVIKIPLLVLMQIVLGFLSFIGFYTLADEHSGRIADRLFGFFLHVVVPATMVAYLTRRSKVEAPSPAAGVAQSG